jgi:hypothetical protein
LSSAQEARLELRFLTLATPACLTIIHVIKNGKTVTAGFITLISKWAKCHKNYEETTKFEAFLEKLLESLDDTLQKNAVKSLISLR